MGLLNPVHALVIPTLFLVTVPLAILAGITTTLAFTVLLLRVFVVYLDMVLSLVPQSVFGLASRSIAAAAASSSSSSSPLASSPSPPRRHKHQHHHHHHHHQLQRHRPRRRTSSGSVVSAGSASSLSERGLGLIPSVGAERDFEGVGGWRVGGAEDDELWTTVSPRLDTPERSLGARPQHHHHRTPSGPTTPGEGGGGGYLMMKGRTRSGEGAAGAGGGGPATRTSPTPTSPNSSRARVPTSAPKIALTGASGGPVDGYFALSRSTSPRATKRY
ncbi:hypothetical protein ACRE_065340 [Hapsidospora chrysogenum ATCC 11550]|uniref:Uncharacterized protein n=1 Tax=Hapsidospora chrysogenum (strain ATCC 11550 / CBS 779.69 / DSM 880 / IAM 14645 / JCM 23072 / IMI 49137) TaxID=857340 RepID=A0A086T063_HAPC1|nr:hypothetical protein ACRE_065340 [Hapsidospora chrysogenum ATCC 11550]